MTEARRDRADAAAVRAYLENPTEAFPDEVVGAILDGVNRIKAYHK